MFTIDIIDYRSGIGITEENIKNFDILLDIRKRHIRCVDTYQETVKRANSFLMSKNSSVSVYGKFPVDPDWLIFDPYKGKLTNNPTQMDFKYYFDEKGRIILTERYSENQLLDYIFYYYYEDHAEVVLYSAYRKAMGKVRYVEWKNSKLYRILTLAGYIPSFGTLRYEEEILSFKETELFVTKKSCDTSNGKVFKNSLIERVYPIRNEEEQGNNASKKVPVFKIIKENMINILNKWKGIDLSVIWVNCQNTDLEMQYTTLKEDCEEKWNIAFYDSDEEKIFNDESHIKAFEDLVEERSGTVEDLLENSYYFVTKMTKIIKDLRKEGCIDNSTAVVLSELEISDATLSVAKKINPKETIKGFLEQF